jgi:hypothetical protein
MARYGAVRSSRVNRAKRPKPVLRLARRSLVLTLLRLPAQAACCFKMSRKQYRAICSADVRAKPCTGLPDGVAYMKLAFFLS